MYINGMQTISKFKGTGGSCPLNAKGEYNLCKSLAVAFLNQTCGNSRHLDYSTLQSANVRMFSAWCSSRTTSIQLNVLQTN